MKQLDAFEECNRILVVAAHADDLETMCGGTVIQLLAQGKGVDLLVATDGDLGARSDQSERLEIARTRREETRHAAETLGLGAVRFLGYPDGGLVSNLQLRREIALAYRLLQPDTIFTFDPLGIYRTNLHPDHAAIAQGAIEAYMPAKMPLYHPEQLRGVARLSRVQYIFCFVTPEPNVCVPVDEVYPQKIAAALLHESQFPEGESDLEWMKARDRQAARACGSEGFEFAELFRSITTY